MEEIASTVRATAPAPEGTRVRRRLVQATLFPHNGSIVDEEEEEDDETEVDDEWCGSQGGRSKKRKQNQTRNSKPRASQKVKSNGKDTSKKKVGDGEFDDVSKSGFFVKVSEKQHQKREQREHVCAASNGVDNNIASNGVCDNVASPPIASADKKTSPLAKSTPKKQRLNTTPKKQQLTTTPKKKATSTPKKKATSTPRKKAMGSGLKGASAGQTPADLTKEELIMHATPNLRLEAKLLAEENSRIYAGKQIHPFFSSRKVDKRSQEIIDLETEQCSLEKEGKGTAFNPVHVFERDENDTVVLDWGLWNFSDTCDLESGASTSYEGSINSLLCDNFLSVLHSTQMLYQNEIFMDLSLNKEEQGTNKTVNIHDDSSCIAYDAEWQGRFCKGSCQNCLWTDRYQPKKAIQVCGNGETVKQLSEWLHLWYERCSQTSKSVKPDDRSIAEDADFYYNQSDCDSEDIDEETDLENVLLVTGPVGSGKSAAIYACAKEQGFQVIEINASDWRNGALVKQRFGEAMESHWLQGTMVNPTTPKSKHLSKSFPVVTSKGSDCDGVELIPLSDEEESYRPSAGGSICSENRTANDKSKMKTLILFEDVDATLYEDSGFISTIQQLAKTAKRPMILTSNSENPLLPNNLDRLHLCFTLPSLEELNGLANVVCAAENSRVHSSMVEHFVDLCQRDIRKTIMNLQFWCQGQYLRRGKELQSSGSSFLFDLDASHRILPKIVPWGYPSLLSEHVEEEITKALMMMEENDNNMEIDKEEELNDRTLRKCLNTPDGKEDYIEAKKHALLSLHCSIEDDDGLAAPYDTMCDFYSSQDSPVAHTQPGIRRKFSAVIFSDSEDDHFTDRKTGASRRMLVNADDDALDVNITALSPSLLDERWCNPSTELLNQFDEQKLEDSFCQHAEMAKYSDINDATSVERSCVPCSHMNDTCDLVEISRVAESSMVPETEFDNQIDLSSRSVSNSHASCREATDSIRNDPLSNLVSIEGGKCFESLSALDGAQEILGSNYHLSTQSVNEEVVGDSQFDRVVDVPIGLMPFEGEKCYQFVPALDGTQEILGSSCHFSAISVNGKVEEDSQFDHVVDVPIGFQILDECSRMDFIRMFKSSQNLVSHHQTDFVQGTWKRLRDSKMDLRQYITPQEKDAFQVMEVSNGFVNLISDADLLLKDCQPLLCDSLYPQMIPGDQSHSHSWHDDQLQMSNFFAEHGISFYAKESAALGSKVGSINSVDLAWEMLASSTSPMALGKLVSEERNQIDSLVTRLPENCAPLRSMMNVLQSIVPLKSYLSLHGNACYEYLSSLSQISRLQDSLTSECVDRRRQRRGRARHYLSSGKFALTSEDISLLGEYNHYQNSKREV